MTRFARLAVPLAGLALLAAPAAADDAPTPQDLVGTWDVALFFSADAPPSSTTLVIDAVEDGVVTGAFYNSAFEVARARAFQDGVIFTGATSDGSGPYLSSGRLEDGVITGQTLSVGRDFLMGWTATRADAE